MQISSTGLRAPVRAFLRRYQEIVGLPGMRRPQMPGAARWLMRRSSAHPEAVWLLLSVLILFCARGAFLPPTLDDIDAFNFDLGVHEYDPVRFRPHPPGYPVFILAAKLSHLVVTSHGAALALVSAVFSSLTVVPLYFLAREFTSRAGAALACVFTLASPLVWFNGVRPMSDTMGLFAVLSAQVLLTRGLRTTPVNEDGGRRLWLLGVIAGGLALGVRAQALFLVAPMLFYGCFRRPRLLPWTAVCLSGAVAGWLLPTLIASGGAGPYLRSLSLLLVTALPQEPLLSAPTLHRAVHGLWDVVGAPWGAWWLGAPMLALATAGAVRLALGNRTPGLRLAMLFLPYAVYHYCMQMTATTRYAMPVVPMLAILAASAVTAWSRDRLSVGALAVAGFLAASTSITGPALIAYAGNGSPASHALESVRNYGPPSEFVVTGNHVFERHLATLGPDFVLLQTAVHKPLASLAGYWKDGGRHPVLFLRNPDRHTLLSVDRATQKTLGQWRWAPSIERLLKGERPLSAELVRVDPPNWFIESGFLVAADAGHPEQIAREDHVLHIRAMATPQRLIASGTVLGAPRADVILRMGNAATKRWAVEQRFSVQESLVSPSGPGYVPVSFQTSQPILFTDVAVTDDASPIIRPSWGFYPAEPTGRGGRFRWVGPQAVAAAFLPSRRGHLRIGGSVPRSYGGAPVRLSLEWNNRNLGEFSIQPGPYRLDCRVTSSGDGTGTLQMSWSDQFIPHERQQNGDMRVLAAQVHDLRLTVASDPAAPGCTLAAE